MQRERGRAPNKSADISFSLKDLTLVSVEIFKRFDQGCKTGFYFCVAFILTKHSFFIFPLSALC